MTAENALILLIERPGATDRSFSGALERKGYRLELAQSGRQAIEAAEASVPAMLVLNAASLGTSGVRVCQRIKEQLPQIPLIHIFPEDIDQDEVRKTPAEVKLTMPFTARKLINSIHRLMPVPRQDVVEVGAIRYAPSVRIVHAHGKEKRLTPRAAQLLTLFIAHPGETLERSYLMQEVWNTDYVGDTRTLDVHVRWVREAVELVPDKPQHLITVRGKGYRFEPGPAQLNGDERKHPL